MGKAKKTRKFAAVKRLISPNDPRIKKKEDTTKKKKEEEDKVKHVEQVSSSMFFQYNTQLGPPYYILVDTNFINFSIKNKLDIMKSMMDCLYAKCIPCITDCVMAELEKLGSQYRVALRIAKDPRFERLPCTHQGTYADDCLVNRISQGCLFSVCVHNSLILTEFEVRTISYGQSFFHFLMAQAGSAQAIKKWEKRGSISYSTDQANKNKCYIVATCDRDLKRRIRKVPGVPIMYISQHRYTIERMPDAYGAPR